MKLENVKEGTEVRVKHSMNPHELAFYRSYHGKVGTVIAVPDSDGDVRVDFGFDGTDIGHYSNLKRVNGNIHES